LFLGTLIVTIVYILANVAYLALLPMHGNPLQEMLSVTESCASNDRVGTAAGMMMGNISVL
jgi:APA family basic amino acid/polyamine antiporter